MRETLNIDNPIISVDSIVHSLKGSVARSSEPVVEVKRVDCSQQRFTIDIPDRKYDEAEYSFLIAHALGHLFLHMRYILDDDEWGKTESYKDSAYYRYGHNIEDHEADRFAMELLMPKKEFIQSANGNLKGGGEYDLNAIASHFKTPIQMVILRGRALGLFSLNPM